MAELHAEEPLAKEVAPADLPSDSSGGQAPPLAQEFLVEDPSSESLCDLTAVSGLGARRLLGGLAQLLTWLGEDLS